MEVHVKNPACFAYVKNLRHDRGGRQVLDIGSLQLEQEKIHVMLGHNGAGKTTLLRLLAGIDRPTSGEILLGVAQSTVIMCLQRPYLFRGTVRFNVEYGLRVRGMTADTDYVKAIINRLGLDILLHRNAAQLSSGEMQRVALARALVCRPRALLLDEPTANLDTQSVRAIEESVRLFCADGATVVVATHMAECVHRLAARVHLIEQGRIVERDVSDAPGSQAETSVSCETALREVC